MATEAPAGAHAKVVGEMGTRGGPVKATNADTHAHPVLGVQGYHTDEERFWEAERESGCVHVQLDWFERPEQKPKKEPSRGGLEPHRSQCIK